MCFLPRSGLAVSSDCGGGACDPFTTQEVLKLLDIHNELRGRLARGEMIADGMPAATDMNKLVWDNGLANMAQAYAETCPSMVNNPNAHVQYLEQRELGNVRWGPDSEVQDCGGEDCIFVGENLLTSTAILTIDSMVSNIEDGWWKEYEDWIFGNFNVGCLGVECGHFTQMAWANTRYVGCGYANGCFNGFNVLICNYFPAGNLQGSSSTPWASGDQCSDCMHDRKICSDGLCGGGMCPTIVDGATVDRGTADNFDTCSDANEDLWGGLFGIGSCDIYDGCVIGGEEWVEHGSNLPSSPCFELSRTASAQCGSDFLFLDGFEPSE